jgi:hypothetical protein
LRQTDSSACAFRKRRPTRYGDATSGRLGRERASCVADRRLRWQDGELFWLGDNDGAPVNNLYNAWAPADPNGNPATADCARFDSSAQIWLDVLCDDLNPFVCEAY